MTKIVTFENRPHVKTNLGATDLPEGTVIVAKLTSKSLVDLHNRLVPHVGGQTTKRFSDLTTGQRRVWAQLEAYGEDQDEAARQADDARAAIDALAEGKPEEAAPVPVAPTPAPVEEDAPAAPPAALPGLEAARQHLGTDPAPAKAPRVKKARPALKQDDGLYVFNMAARPAGKFKTIGGRRPELMDFLRKGPTFRELMAWYKPRGDDLDTRAFNMATAVTCMCHVVGCGVFTEGQTSGGRIIFSEAL